MQDRSGMQRCRQALRKIDEDEFAGSLREGRPERKDAQSPRGKRLLDLAPQLYPQDIKYLLRHLRENQIQDSATYTSQDQPRSEEIEFAFVAATPGRDLRGRIGVGRFEFALLCVRVDSPSNVSPSTLESIYTL